MKKTITLHLILCLAIVISSLYGVIHDQLTYTLSPEYYTKFKFIQFGLAQTAEDAIFACPRVEVFFVGIMATWWMGIPIGILLGLTGLIHRDRKDMLMITLKAFGVVAAVTILTGLIGLAYGFYEANHHLQSFTAGWYIPEGLINTKNFVAVGSMHNFSYLGGLLGIVAGVVYSVRNRRLKSVHN